MKQELIYKDLSYKITGILFEVQNELGRFCSEKQCGDLLEKKLIERKMRYEREKFLPESFSGEHKNRNKIDFLIEDKIILEIKSKRMIEKSDFYQTKRYLVAFNKKLGILVNFRDRYLKPKRVINSQFAD
jgi:GxxExxY protein